MSGYEDGGVRVTCEETVLNQALRERERLTVVIGWFREHLAKEIAPPVPGGTAGSLDEAVYSRSQP